MPWPSKFQFRNALQHPGRTFRDAALRAGSVALDGKGLPVVACGGFAMVFKVTVGGRPVAVRVYHAEKHARRGEEHYRTLAEHLRQGRPGSLVPFDYQPQGVQLDDAWYPLLTMEWVDGITLLEWVRRQVQAGAAAELRAMADRWAAMVRELKQYRIAHG